MVLLEEEQLLLAYNGASRELDAYSYIFGDDATNDDELYNFTSKLQPASDVSVDTVIASLYFNIIIFCVLMGSYEILRRILPSVYAARRERVRVKQGTTAVDSEGNTRVADFIEDLPTNATSAPLTWIGPVFGVPWIVVKKVAGLDGYFFLRYIRMCLRITAVSTFWSLVILIPTFLTGSHYSDGWYHISMMNITNKSWRMWVPCVFIYLFSAFVFFVMKQEYRHFIELRMDFLGKGDSNINPQQHYSLAVQMIPMELRSDRALYDYFNRLFPGKIHSASVVMNVPDLEAADSRRLRIVKRLEKSIAYDHAEGERPSHVVGRKRLSVCAIDLPAMECCHFNHDVEIVGINDAVPDRGTRVDAISYYTRELAESNKDVFLMQRRQIQVAETGNASVRAYDWLSMISDFASGAAFTILEDSAMDNDLISPRSSSVYEAGSGDVPEIPQAERMTSMYGSITQANKVEKYQPKPPTSKRASLGEIPTFSHDNSEDSWAAPSVDSEDKAYPLLTQEEMNGINKRIQKRTAAPGSRDKERRCLRRLAGRLGLDFFVAGMKFGKRQLDVVKESVSASTMSPNGFVTFLDLASVTCAACTPLTNKPNVLLVSVAPEPRDVVWKNAPIDTRVVNQREHTANIFVYLGIILWSIPLTAIQAFATAEQLARIPGMEWILAVNNGKLAAFINGYLPVVALLGLILCLPVIFGLVARNYECRRTHSDIQRSMLSRYFYYQLANIYITVTAGSLWRSLAEILERPQNVLELLGRSLPTVVGYFVALLITKILAGLPMVFLRVGALSRMVFLRTLFSKKMLTQRELDEVYRPENVQYGWEFPTQLLVIVICFTYACICPIILPVGMVFFAFALMVYKKQLLYVYTPVYESGGALFPDVCQKTLYGLLCGQLTFIGYTIIRGCHYEPVFLLPLPFLTLWVIGYFNEHYAKPSKQLSMERAKECDRVSDLKAARRRCVPHQAGQGVEERREVFDKSAYRQPVLTVHAMLPMDYRAGEPDPLTEDCRRKLRDAGRYEFMSDNNSDTGVASRYISDPDMAATERSANRSRNIV